MINNSYKFTGEWSSEAAGRTKLDHGLEGDLELQAQIEEATAASLETALQERGMKRRVSSAGLHDGLGDAGSVGGAHGGRNTPCSAAHGESMHGQPPQGTHNHVAASPDVAASTCGGAVAVPPLSHPEGCVHACETSKRLRMGGDMSPLPPQLLHTQLLQQQQSSCAGSETGAAAAGSCDGAVCGSYPGRVPSPGVEMQLSDTSALTAGGGGRRGGGGMITAAAVAAATAAAAACNGTWGDLLAIAAAGVDRGGAGNSDMPGTPRTASQGAASTQWQAPAQWQAPPTSMPPLRRFYRGQV